jgi:hypothetical protein
MLALVYGAGDKHDSQSLERQIPLRRPAGTGRTTDPLDAMPGKEAPVSALRDSKTARFGATMLFEASRLLEIIPPSNYLHR